MLVLRVPSDEDTPPVGRSPRSRQGSARRRGGDHRRARRRARVLVARPGDRRPRRRVACRLARRAGRRARSRRRTGTPKGCRRGRRAGDRVRPPRGGDGLVAGGATRGGPRRGRVLDEPRRRVGESRTEEPRRPRRWARRRGARPVLPPARLPRDDPGEPRSPARPPGSRRRNAAPRALRGRGDRRSSRGAGKAGQRGRGRDPRRARLR